MEKEPIDQKLKDVIFDVEGRTNNVLDMFISDMLDTDIYIDNTADEWTEMYNWADENPVVGSVTQYIIYRLSEAKDEEEYGNEEQQPVRYKTNLFYVVGQASSDTSKTKLQQDDELQKVAAEADG